MLKKMYQEVLLIKKHQTKWNIIFYTAKMEIKMDLDEDLPLKKTLRLYNIIILIKSVFNKNHNLYYYVLLSKKFLYN